MATRMTFKDHVLRSVDYDEVLVNIGTILQLLRKDELMLLKFDRAGGDVRVRVARPGEPWRETWANDTSKIDQMWSR